MSHRSVRFPFTAFLFALAVFALLARPGHAQPDAADIIPGDVVLELPAVVPSSLDTPTLETALCGKINDQGGAGEVGLTSANDGSSGPFILPVLGVELGELEDTARVSAGPFYWTGLEPFPTHCGRWSYTVTLDPDALQPPSDLTLGRAGGSEPTAPFAGTVEAAVLLRFSDEDGGTREIPVRLRLDLAGHWTVGKTAGAAGGSNLVLFVEQATAALLDPS
jgi:hypothetical protein